MFWGCESTGSNPVEQENTYNTDSYSVKSSSKTEGEEYSYKYLSLEYREINPRMYSLESTYFIGLIQSGIEYDKLIFNKESFEIPFSQKLEVVEKMIEKQNYKGAVQKIEQDIIPKLEDWITIDHVYSVQLALEFTIYMLTTDFDEYILNVDYFDNGDTIGGWAWTQIIDSGEEESIFQLEANNDVFLNDPVFWIIADLPEMIGSSYLISGKWNAAINECICPSSVNNCKCCVRMSPAPPAPRL
jgi:hypothetical protein